MNMNEAPPKSDFQHAESDFRWKVESSKRKAAYIPNVTVRDSPMLLQESVTKPQLLKFIEDHAKKAVEIGVTNLIIYYSGHGNQDNGAWKCSIKKGTIHFDKSEYLVEFHEIIEAICRTEYKNAVELTSDSCYSGKLCVAASKLYMEDLRKVKEEDAKPSISRFTMIKVDGSTSPDRKAVWGEFTEYKRIKNGGKYSEAEVKDRANVYVEEFGLSEFSSKCIESSHLVASNEMKHLPGIWIRTRRTDAKPPQEKEEEKVAEDEPLGNEEEKDNEKVNDKALEEESKK